MQQIYMTKDDKIDFIDRINTVNEKIETVNRKFDAFENKLFHKMEVNFRWLITLALLQFLGEFLWLHRLSG